MFISKLAKNPAITFFTIAKYSASSSMGHGSWSPSLKKFHETGGLINILSATSNTADSLIKLSVAWSEAAHKGKHNDRLMFLPSLHNCPNRGREGT